MHSNTAPTSPRSDGAVLMTDDPEDASEVNASVPRPARVQWSAWDTMDFGQGDNSDNRCVLGLGSHSFTQHLC